MPRYVYECEKCEHSHTEIHGMKDDPKIKCSKCQGACFRVVQPVRALVRGNCYFNKKDCKTQSTIATLKENDPYAKHRVPGEKEDMITKIRNKGKSKKMFKMS